MPWLRMINTGMMFIDCHFRDGIAAVHIAENSHSVSSASSLESSLRKVSYMQDTYVEWLYIEEQVLVKVVECTSCALR
eukprot:scaffold150079_cov22-Prasinocladus_malaysianus.AAC.1